MTRFTSFTILVTTTDNLAQLTFNIMDFTSNMSSVRLQFGFSGAPGTNAAAKPRQSRSLTVQPRQQVFQLCQLHLRFRFFCMSAFGKNIQYELTPIDNLCSEHITSISNLTWRQLIIGDDQINIIFFN